MPSAHYVHPEFGYFWPGRGLRRELRVAVIAILLGMIVGSSVVRLRASGDCNANNAQTIAQVELSSAATVLPVAAELRSTLINGDAAKAEPNESIKSYPMRMVRVRPAKNSSPLAAIPLGRTPPAEPPVASVAAEPTRMENGEGLAARAAPADTASSATTSQPSAKAKKPHRLARNETRRRNDEDDE
jgi:hypothetical protein